MVGGAYCSNFSRYRSPSNSVCLRLQTSKSPSFILFFQYTNILLRRRSEEEIPSSCAFSLGMSESSSWFSLKRSHPNALWFFLSSEKSSGLISCVVNRSPALPSEREEKPLKYAGSLIMAV